MRRQTRPFTMEIRHKRRNQKKNRSIWGDLDLSDVASETEGHVEAVEIPISSLIDSDVLSIDAGNSGKQRAEDNVADPKEAETVQNEASAQAKASRPTKKIPGSTKARVQLGRAGEMNAGKRPARVSEAPGPAVRPGPKVYSEKEREQKLDEVRQSISRGHNIKSAIGHAGVSEQTYYQWKRAAASSKQGDDLKDIVALEEENLRLEKFLAERLRKENADFKKKLGMK